MSPTLITEQNNMNEFEIQSGWKAFFDYRSRFTSCVAQYGNSLEYLENFIVFLTFLVIFSYLNKFDVDH